jgi:hypothetical protein
MIEEQYHVKTEQNYMDGKYQLKDPYLVPDTTVKK